MLSIKQRNNKASDIKLVSLYSIMNINLKNVWLYLVNELNNLLYYVFYTYKDRNRPLHNSGKFSRSVLSPQVPFLPRAVHVKFAIDEVAMM